MYALLLPAFYGILVLCSIILLITNIIRIRTENYSSLSSTLAIAFGIIDAVLNFLLFGAFGLLSLFFGTINGCDGTDFTSEVNLFLVGLPITLIIAVIGVILIVLGIKQHRNM